MGFYRKFVLPHLINLAMSNKDVARRRSEMIPLACGEILEIGIGSGLNLPFYSDRVIRICGVDPSSELLQMARKKTGSLTIPVQLLNGSAEQLPLENQVVDTIVMTWTLCSIPDPNKALAEMLRVLKPGGDLLFIEHGRAPETKVEAWQDRINRPWRALAGGCNLNRKIDGLIWYQNAPLVGRGVCCCLGRCLEFRQNPTWRRCKRRWHQGMASSTSVGPARRRVQLPANHRR
jgi:SAM-dependent methyltransferase